MIFSSELSPPGSVQASPLFSTLPSPFESPLSTPPLDAKALPVATHDRKVDNIIFDLGDILLTSTVNTGTSLSPQTLRRMLHSITWFEYEKGNISEEETYRLIAKEFSVDVSEVVAAFRAARNSFQSNSSMVTLLHELKGNSDIRLFAMSNLSAPDWEVLRHNIRRKDLTLFESVFTSAMVHERKPNLGYFRHVLESTGIDPSRTVLVDKLESVIPARSLGLKGIVFTSTDQVSREIRALVRNPIIDGEAYLRAHAKRMDSVTNSGVVLEENFAQLLILEATGDASLVDYIKHPRLTNYFKSAPVLTTSPYPNDLDTTSIACTVSDHFSKQVKSDIMDEMLTLKNKDGIIQLYFDTTRPRTDAVVCVNILTLFYANGRGSEVKETFDWVYEVLKHRAYANGTHYYHGPDPFLYFLSRLLAVSVDARRRLGALYVKRVTELFGSEGDALALAMRVHAAAEVDMCDSRDYERLCRMQEADGSWPLGWGYKFGTAGVTVGNKGWTTAMAVSAIRRYQDLELHLRSFD